MKLTEKAKGSAENMALEVYVSCQQLICFPCADVCDQQHQNWAKLKAVHTDKFITMQQIGAPAANWKAY